MITWLEVLFGQPLVADSNISNCVFNLPFERTMGKYGKRKRDAIAAKRWRQQGVWQQGAEQRKAQRKCFWSYPFGHRYVHGWVCSGCYKRYPTNPGVG